MATQKVTSNSFQRVAMGLEDADAYGTPVQPNLLLEEHDNSLDNVHTTVTQRVGAGKTQRVHVARGFEYPEGTLPLLITPEKCGPLFYALLGAVATTGSSAPYTHVITPSLDGSRPSMTLEHMYSNLYRVMSGMTIVSADFSAANGDMLRCSLTVSGKQTQNYDSTQCDAAVAWDAIDVLTSPMMEIERDSSVVTDTYNPSWTITNDLVFAEPQQKGVYAPRTGAGAGGVGATIRFFLHSEASDPEGLLRDFLGDTGSSYPVGPAAVGTLPRIPIKFTFESSEDVGTSSTAYSLVFEFPYAYISGYQRGSFNNMQGWDVEMTADVDESSGVLCSITLVNSVDDITTAATAIA